jgi:hypothetical protein
LLFGGLNEWAKVNARAIKENILNLHRQRNALPIFWAFPVTTATACFFKFCFMHTDSRLSVCINNLLYRKIFITAALTFFCLGYLDRLSIGTVLSAFTMGKVVGIIGTYTDKFFYFETYKTLKKTDKEIK